TNIKVNKKYSCLEGDDHECYPFKRFRIDMPKVKHKGFYVTELDIVIDSIRYSFERGATKVNVTKNGEVIFLQHEPSTRAQAKIISELEGTKKGNYIVGYDVRMVLNKES